MINYWTEAEIAMLRENILPPGRKLKSAYTKAFRLGICFCPVTKKSFKAQREQPTSYDQHYAAMTQQGLQAEQGGGYGVYICRGCA